MNESRWQTALLTVIAALLIVILLRIGSEPPAALDTPAESNELITQRLDLILAELQFHLDMFDT